MRQTAMAQHVAVRNLQPKADHVGIGQHRAHRRPRPEALRPLRSIEAACCKSRDGVGEDSRHSKLTFQFSVRIRAYLDSRPTRLKGKSVQDVAESSWGVQWTFS